MEMLERIMKARDLVAGRLMEREDTESREEPALAHNFVGLGPGYRTRAGEPQGELCLVVYVRTKLDPDFLGRFDVHPKDKSKRRSYLHEIGDIPVDVVETGRIRSLAGPRYDGPVSQLVIGADVTLADSATHGTACAFARVQGDEQPHLLSCGHVLDSCGGQFHLVVSREQVVARIDKQADLLPGFGLGFPCQQDAVRARLLRGVQPNLELPGGLGRLSTADPIRPYPGMAVIKAGKTVEDGKVACSHATVLVDYASQSSILQDQILVEVHSPTFARVGDSGALVVARLNGPNDEGQLWPVGMIIAAGDPVTLLPKGTATPRRYAVVSPMREVLNSLGAELWV